MELSEFCAAKFSVIPTKASWSRPSCGFHVYDATTIMIGRTHNSWLIDSKRRMVVRWSPHKIEECAFRAYLWPQVSFLSPQNSRFPNKKIHPCLMPHLYPNPVTSKNRINSHSSCNTMKTAKSTKPLTETSRKGNLAEALGDALKQASALPHTDLLIGQR